MKYDNPQLIDSLAAEYVLGTLRGPARRRFDRLRTEAWHVQRRVESWEDRLTPLALGLKPVEPSPQVWAGIEQRIGVTRRAQSRFSGMRALAAVVALIAIFAGGYTMWRYAFAPDFVRLATIAAEAGPTAWEIEIDDQRTRIRATAFAGATPREQNSYELWALPDDGSAPVSLGLLPDTGRADRELTAAQRAALQSASRVAVSLEPRGGSTTGAPTGPVLFVAERARDV